MLNIFALGSFSVRGLLVAYWRRVNKQLKVNKQLTISKFINFHAKHLCSWEFQCQRPLSGLLEKSKQTAESKQTADITKTINFH